MCSSMLDRVWEIPAEFAALESRIAALRSEQLALIGELDRIVPADFPMRRGKRLRSPVGSLMPRPRKRLDTARAITTAHSGSGTEPVLSATACALADGETSLAHAHAMAAATRGLDTESARWVEVQVLADPRARTPGQLAHRARKAALQVGAGQAQRQAAAQADRELLAFEFDGRVSFAWSMPSVDAAVVATWLDGVAGR